MRRKRASSPYPSHLKSKEWWNQLSLPQTHRSTLTGVPITRVNSDVLSRPGTLSTLPSATAGEELFPFHNPMGNLANCTCATISGGRISCHTLTISEQVHPHPTTKDSFNVLPRQGSGLTVPCATAGKTWDQFSKALQPVRHRATSTQLLEI